MRFGKPIEVCHSFLAWSSSTWKIASLNILNCLLENDLSKYVLKKERLLISNTLADIITIRMTSPSPVEQDIASLILETILKSPDGIYLQYPKEGTGIIEPPSFDNLKQFMLNGFNETTYAISTISEIGDSFAGTDRSESPINLPDPPTFNIKMTESPVGEFSNLKEEEKNEHQHKLVQIESSDILVNELMGLVSSSSASDTTKIISDTALNTSAEVEIELNSLMNLVEGVTSIQLNSQIGATNNSSSNEKMNQNS